ncbi:hypothetical protein [Mycolicibacter sinensis]|uniref:hypothetical protein n=1 Tax=Mycolicibacter sinensis (strain JDM601) TaxID=875328 RepID=UPI0010421675|nr:hypothetical protein [Mycolicibacter sinensis]
MGRHGGAPAHHGDHPREIEYGIARLPDGRRKDRLADAASRVFGEVDDGILAFGTTAARRYGEIEAARSRVVDQSRASM